MIKSFEEDFDCMNSLFVLNDKLFDIKNMISFGNDIEFGIIYLKLIFISI